MAQFFVEFQSQVYRQEKSSLETFRYNHNYLDVSIE